MTRSLPVAVVTGASKGIGKAITQKLSHEGLSCLTLASSNDSISKIKLGDHLSITHEDQRHRSLAIDFSDWPKWTTSKEHFGIDLQLGESNYELLDMLRSWSSTDKKYYLALLVNCAGITQTSLSVRTSTTSMATIMNVNLMSCVSLCNMAVKSMIRDRRYRPGKTTIVNVGSILGTDESPILPGTSLYAASKAALNRYSEVLAQEVSGLDIAVETINPGLVSTSDMIQNLSGEVQSELHRSMGSNDTSMNQIASTIWSLYSRNAQVR